MDVERMLGKAREEAGRRNFDYSIRLYQEILGLVPESIEARRGLREAELRKYAKRYPSRVEAALRGLIPRVAVAVLGLAKQHRALLGACERYLRHDPRNLRVNEALAEAAAQLGMLDTAILVFEGIAETHPSNADAFKRLGDLYHARGLLEPSLGAYEKALALRPHDPDVEKARKNLAAEGAIRSSGLDRARSSRDLVRDKEELRRIEASKRMVRSPEEIAEAIREAEERLREHPDDARVLRELAELYYRKGDVEEAIQVLEEALELEPGSEEILGRIGDWKMRRLARMVESLQGGGSAEALERARAEERAFRVAEHTRRVKAHPTDLAGRFRLGSALRDEGRIDEAIAEFQQSIRDPKRRVDSLLGLGDCFFRKKMYDLASKQLLEALEAASGSQKREMEIRYVLGTVYEAKGDRARARESYARVYEKDIQYRDVAARMDALRGEPADASGEDPSPGPS